jgi:L-lysine exporter family protein LysE/ArgO
VVLRLALGAARFAPWLARPATWRALDLAVAAMMLWVAWGLLARG